MSVVQNFVDILNELKNVKSGVSGKRIKQLTDMAINNVGLSSQFVDKTFEYLQTTKETHRLGGLYVIDSIARAFQGKAADLGETVNAQASEGTFAGALYRFDTIVQQALTLTLDVASDEQKEKVSKLVDIWERSGTFSSSSIDPIKEKYFGQAPKKQEAPPPQAATATPTSAQDILKNLASLQSNVSSAPAAVPAQAQPQTNAFPPLPQIPGMPTDPQAAIMAMLAQMQNNGQLPVIPPQQQQQQQQQQQHDNYGERSSSRPPLPNTALSQEEAFRNFRGGSAGSSDRESRSGSGFSRRNRSRSPRRKDQKDLPPPGHVIGEKNIPGTAHYRERHVDFDPNMPSNSIKVQSRTLFIGGVPTYMTQDELKSVLRPYAEVQSVILHSERKHAFVKTYSRKEAENVIANFNKTTTLSLRVRWGVGFGPRDCCDYQHGVSIIPLDRLTDADKRWVNEAEWGGIGMETPLRPNLVMEEPDIAIGEGVSSKAISKKMPTDGSRNGPRSTKPGEPDDMYTDPLNQATLPSFMQGQNNRANPLAGLFAGNSQGAPPPPPAMGSPAGAGAVAPAGSAAANDQLAQLMAMLKGQGK